jgi:hypothetical protein
VKCERLSREPGSERVKKAPPYRVPATPLISSSSWMGRVPAARLSEISVDVKEGMAVPAALTRIRALVLVRELWTANRCFPYHLVRGIVHSANLDPSPEGMSLEAGSGHPRRYVPNYGVCEKTLTISRNVAKQTYEQERSRQGLSLGYRPSQCPFQPPLPTVHIAHHLSAPYGRM